MSKDKYKNEKVKHSGLITCDELKDGMKLFYRGTKAQAQRIQNAQHRRFGLSNGLFLLNHCGDIIVNKDGMAICYEQDGWGKFGTSIIAEEYKDDCKKYGGEVYIGIYPILSKSQLRTFRDQCYEYESSDDLVNYSYSSLINYFWNSIMYPITKKDHWIFKKAPNGTTCSQISAKLSIDNFGINYGKEFYKVYPCEIAMYGDIVIKKLIF